jgi:integrase
VKQFAEHFGPTPLGEVERFSARTWALSVPRYVSRTVRTMYEDARNVGLVDHNPFSNLRLPAVERTEQIKAPSLDEYRRILEACRVLGPYGAEFRPMVQFSAWTGVRAGELQALKWEDIGTDSVRIRRARKRDGIEKKPKNGREREIALLPPARVPR